MKRYLFFFIVLLSFCFNWNRVEAKSKTSREEKGCTGLDHNRFRYYDSNSGTYISKDPIGLAGNNPNLYAYTHDSNSWVDPFGLNECGENSWNKFQKQHKGIFKNSLEASKAYNELKINKNPWPYDYTPKNEVLNPGEKIRMVMGEGQPTNRPGGWATMDEITDVNMAREKLAITKEFKDNIGYVQEYEVIKELPVKTGPVGPQIDGIDGSYYHGGGSQIQLDVPPAERMDYLKPTSNYKIE